MVEHYLVWEIVVSVPCPEDGPVAYGAGLEIDFKLNLGPRAVPYQDFW